MAKVTYLVAFNIKQSWEYNVSREQPSGVSLSLLALVNLAGLLMVVVVVVVAAAVAATVHDGVPLKQAHWPSRNHLGI